jgi:hypothetical protein
VKTIAIRVGAIAVVVIVLTSPASSQNADPPRPGKTPAGRYTYPATGTVYDTKTKLTWQQTATSVMYAWADAKTYCAGVGATLGGTGWRLPTLKELQTIVDETREAPSIDPTVFPGASADFFWSSSPVAGVPSFAWAVNFHWGASYVYALTSSNAVRCVR